MKVGSSSKRPSLVVIKHSLGNSFCPPESDLQSAVAREICRNDQVLLLQAEGDLLGLLGLSPPASGTTVKPSSKPSENWATF